MTKLPFTIESVRSVDERKQPQDGLSKSTIACALRKGICPTDQAFDRFLPHDLRAVSGSYWTPLMVALRAAEWLDEVGARTVLDIGSGAGKFCVAAALAGHARITGIEQRARLVSASSDLAARFGVGERVTFIHGTFGETSVPSVDAYYLYNPFGENLFGSEDHLDEDVELGDARFLRDIHHVEHLLDGAAGGTFLLTYNGFGGEVPADYQPIRVDPDLPRLLRMWQKVPCQRPLSKV